jgi:polyisoprenoid-binding protein YceI
MSIAVEHHRAPAIASTGRWTVDPRHSSVEFAVQHLLIATVRGRFRDFEGALEIGDDPPSVRGHGIVNVESIDTGEPHRDDYLLSPVFFNVDVYPEIEFTFERVEPIEGNPHRMVGEITITGVTLELAFDATLEGRARDSWGNERIALELTGHLNRKAFGLTWDQLVEGGGAGVDDTIRLELALSLVRQSEWSESR